MAKSTVISFPVKVAVFVSPYRVTRPSFAELKIVGQRDAKDDARISPFVLFIVVNRIESLNFHGNLIIFLRVGNFALVTKFVIEFMIRTQSLVE